MLPLRLRSWLRSLLSTDQPARPVRRSSKQRRGPLRCTPLRLETLEDRAVPATFAVTSLLDDGSAGTLRLAIEQANATVEADSIDLTGLSGTITLNGNQLSIMRDLTITGPGADQLAVSGNHLSRVFYVDRGGGVGQGGLGVIVSISGL